MPRCCRTRSLQHLLGSCNKTLQRHTQGSHQPLSCLRLCKTHQTSKPQQTHMYARNRLKQTHTLTRAHTHINCTDLLTYTSHINIPRYNYCLPLASKATAPLDVCVPAIQELRCACVQYVLCVQSLRGLQRFTCAAANMRVRVRVCMCVCGFGWSVRRVCVCVHVSVCVCVRSVCVCVWLCV